MKFSNFQAYVIKKGLYSWFFNHLKFDNFTLDIDSSVMMRYDEQQGSGQRLHKQQARAQISASDYGLCRRNSYSKSKSKSKSSSI